MTDTEIREDKVRLCICCREIKPVGSFRYKAGNQCEDCYKVKVRDLCHSRDYESRQTNKLVRIKYKREVIYARNARFKEFRMAYKCLKDEEPFMKITKAILMTADERTGS